MSVRVPSPSWLPLLLGLLNMKPYSRYFSIGVWILIFSFIPALIIGVLYAIFGIGFIDHPMLLLAAFVFYIVLALIVSGWAASQAVAKVRG